MTSFYVTGYGLWAFWFLAACAVGFGVFLTKGSDAASSYAAGYLLEMSLSVDNFCAFLLLFRLFNVRLSGMTRLSSTSPGRDFSVGPPSWPSDSQTRAPPPQVDPHHQGRVLQWGIIGAGVMRGIFIGIVPLE